MELTDEMWGVLIGHLASTSTNAQASHAQLIEIDRKLARISNLMESMIKSIDRVHTATVSK
jgi:hypothetical protein